jgi:hypothetical protein
MITVKTAKQLVNTIYAFNFDKTDEVSRWYCQGCEFTLSHGLIGYIHPYHGWLQTYDFNGSDPRGGTAVENIQWVLDEYGNEYTFHILDMVEYLHEELGTYISPPRKCGDHFIGTCREREAVEDLEKEGVIKILSIDPLQ